MGIQEGRFAFPRDERDNAPSSGDGASVESRYDPNTGARIPGGGITPADPGRMDTRGGLDSHLSRNRGHEHAYRETQAASSGVHPDGGGAGLGLPTDVDRFSTSGHISADSNLQSTTTTGGPPEPLVQVNTGGIGPDSDSNETAAGRPIA